MTRDAVWNEAGALGVDMTIAQTALTMGVEALRDHGVKLVLCSRHRDIEKAAFFLRPYHPPAESPDTAR